MTDEQATTIKIAGREFEMTTRALTGAQENFINGHLRAAGVIALLRARKDNTNGEDLLTALLISGRTEDVLAGMLVEKGKRWTYDQARENAEAFRSTDDADDKTAMQALLFGVIEGFTPPVAKSLPTSPNSLPSEGAHAGTEAAADSVNAVPVS